MSEITGLHHVGLIVHDMSAALNTFRAFGFHLGPPAYPALPEPIGAGNTHADFPRNFIELLAFVPDDAAALPEDAKLVPLQIPEEHRAATRAALMQTVSGLKDRLHRFEGAHILVFATGDAGATAARLDREGVSHGGARPGQRPITTAEGVRLEAIRYLEINDDDPASSPGLLPEGRIGAAEDAPGEVLDAQIGLAHPNGAKALAECVLCVADVDAAAARYERYLGIAPSAEDGNRIFDLGTGFLVLTTVRDLAAWLPGERPRTVPALCACVVEVEDVAAAEDLLSRNGIKASRTSEGEPFIPATRAHGTAVVFCEASTA